MGETASRCIKPVVVVLQGAGLICLSSLRCQFIRLGGCCNKEAAAG
jgi:hypothetical protein